MAHLALPDVPAPLVDHLARSAVALSAADPWRPDCPLVAVNAAFCETTGYAPEDLLGRNCRLLQPPGGPGPVRERMRAFLDAGHEREARFAVPNQRRDGTPFLNLVYMAKLTQGRRTRLVLGAQFDLTRHRVGQAAYDAALAADLGSLATLLRQGDGMVLGSLDILARSQRVLAQARLDL